MPLFVGRIKALYWHTLVDIVKSKLMGWKNKTLSYARRLCLIKHTLQSIPIYLALIFKIPIALASKIYIICRDFLWSGANEEKKKKFSLVSYKRIYYKKSKGGLGLRKVKWLSMALRGRMAWRLIIEEDRD